MHPMIHKMLLTLAFAALTTQARADTVSTLKAIGNTETSDLRRACQNYHLTIGGDGIIGKVNNMSSAIRCFSMWNHLGSCFKMAAQAATFLDLERTGQSTFAALTSKVESESTDAETTNGLSLAESAPTNMSPDQLGRNVYKQCASYVFAS